MLTIKQYIAPCGTLVLGDYGGYICMCDWAGERRHEAVMRRLRKILKAGVTTGSTPLIEMAISRLDEYFSRERTQFDLPLLFVGTEFQKTVWKSLLGISYGELRSYGALASEIGRPGSVRAVANAVGANPMSILVPCHRVVGADGSLTGYAGGLTAKRLLLSLETKLKEKFEEGNDSVCVTRRALTVR